MFDVFSASLTSTDILNENTIIYGRMPKSENEIVLDKMVLNRLLASSFYNAKFAGLNDLQDFVGRKASIYTPYTEAPSIKMDDFEVVGICNAGAPSVYMSEKVFVNVLTNSLQSDPHGGLILTDNGEENNYLSHKIYDVNLAKSKIELTKGKMPQKDYEIIVNESNKYELELGDKIDDKINNHKLKVVGYYTSKENIDDFFATNSTIKYKLLQDKNNITICPKDKAKTINYFNENGIYIEDTYETDRASYIISNKDAISSSVILASIILAISLIEIFLMMRSSFLARVKEVGILRAIGVKKLDIYKMFLGEIIAITIVT